MMKQINLGIAALVAFCVGATNAQAQDDIFVDLSVLESLSGTGASTYNISAPKFPVVKKSPVVKKKSTPKPVAQKVKIAPKPPVLEKSEVKAPIVVENKAEHQNHQPIPYIESSEPVVVVDVEPSVDTKTKEVPAIKEQPASVEAPVLVPAPAKEPTEETTAENSLSANTSIVDTPKPEDKLVEEHAPTLLIDPAQTSQMQPSTKGVISFADGEDTLTTEQQAQIDATVASFENPSVNKIAIYSYNLDDGVDSFKKKRLSLNRAVEIRSYLLPKGYKNFSIKVINVDANSQKGNTVELEELKN
ncbi:MAG: hypothetical protein E7018_01740 [Alphaproteobacteria bacterium]|nr:hypothetical protein [Alphaproteobacteria bacterium]